MFPRRLSQGLSGACRFSRGQRVLYLALSHRHQHGQELPGCQGRRPPGSDIDAQEAEQYEGQSALKEYETPERFLLKDEIAATCSRRLKICRKIAHGDHPAGT
jgi:hypothetical protein